MRSLLFIGVSAMLLSASVKDSRRPGAIACPVGLQEQNSFWSAQAELVFVCGNGTTKVYHLKESCHSLKRCSHKTIKMNRSEAKADGLRLCGNEN